MPLNIPIKSSLKDIAKMLQFIYLYFQFMMKVTDFENMNYFLKLIS